MATCDVHVPSTKRTMAVATIPTEIVTEEILPKLPAKSLVRFKCLSKLYNTWISSPKFIDIHLRQSLSKDDRNRLLIFVGKDGSSLYSFDIDSPDPSPAVKIPIPCAIEEPYYDSSDPSPSTPEELRLDESVSIIGSLHGLLCVSVKLRMHDPNYSDYMPVVINPCTGEYKELCNVSVPHVSNEFRVSFGFGYDDTKQDYKLVAIVEYAEQYCPYSCDIIMNRDVMVCSLKESGIGWKFVETRDRPKDSLDYGQHGVLMKNHLIHWLFRRCIGEEYRICCFDVRSEKWVEDVPLMDLFTFPMGDFHEEYYDKRDYVHKLGVMYDCLCLSTSTDSSQIVWIMKEYGVKESWVKLIVISNPRFGLCGLFFSSGLFGFRQGSKQREVLVQDVSGTSISRLCWCDIESGGYGKTETIDSVPDFGDDACFFVGSLVPIPGGQQIKSASSVD